MHSFRSGFFHPKVYLPVCAPDSIRRGIRWQREHQRLRAAGRFRWTLETRDPRCAASDSGFLPPGCGTRRIQLNSPGSWSMPTFKPAERPQDGDVGGRVGLGATVHPDVSSGGVDA